MSNIVPIKVQLPAHLQKFKAHVAKTAEEALGGIKFGGFARLSISGGKFHFVKDGKAHLITDPRDKDKPQDRRNPLMTLPVVVVRSNPALSKQFYEKQYNPGAADEPDCASDDGIAPNAGVPNKQASLCATCRHNKWGSRKTPAGKDAKACSDNKRLAVVPENALKFEPMSLVITPAALKGWGEYVKALSQAERPVFGVVTELSFDSSADYPRLKFNYGRDLTEEELEIVMERQGEEAVLNVINPKGNFQSGEKTQETEPVVPAEKNHQPADSSVTLGEEPQAGSEEGTTKGDESTPTAFELEAANQAPTTEAEAEQDAAKPDTVDLPFGGTAPAAAPKAAPKSPSKGATKDNLSAAPEGKVVVKNAALTNALAKALKK